MTVDIATESQTDRIVRLALLAGRYARDLDAARAACAGCVVCAETRAALHERRAAGTT